MANGRRHFDRSYYERYYKNPSTRVSTESDVRRLGGFVCSYLKHLDVSVHRVVDLGCGLGYWQQVIAEHFPKARYTGVEISDYLCEEYGWEHGSVTDYRTNASFDLVVCQGVLQYVPNSEARDAVANLANLCRGALYLEVLTTEDWRENCDRGKTDGSVHRRSADWYRRHLRRHFVNCGGGVFVRRDGDYVLYELEKLW